MFILHVHAQLKVCSMKTNLFSTFFCSKERSPPLIGCIHFRCFVDEIDQDTMMFFNFPFFFFLFWYYTCKCCCCCSIVHVKFLSARNGALFAGFKSFARFECHQVCAAVIMGCRCGYVTPHAVNKWRDTQSVWKGEYWKLLLLSAISGKLQFNPIDPLILIAVTEDLFWFFFVMSQ